MMMEYKLSPSDLTFLYDQCKHCFVLEVKHGISQPSIPIPGVFSTISNLQKNYYSDMRTEKFCPDLPPGVVSYGEKRVRSKTIRLEGCNSSFFISGQFDRFGKNPYFGERAVNTRLLLQEDVLISLRNLSLVHRL